MWCSTWCREHTKHTLIPGPSFEWPDTTLWSSRGSTRFLISDMLLHSSSMSFHSSNFLVIFLAWTLYLHSKLVQALGLGKFEPFFGAKSACIPVLTVLCCRWFRWGLQATCSWVPCYALWRVRCAFPGYKFAPIQDTRAFGARSCEAYDFHILEGDGDSCKIRRNLVTFHTAPNRHLQASSHENWGWVLGLRLCTGVWGNSSQRWSGLGGCQRSVERVRGGVGSILWRLACRQSPGLQCTNHNAPAT